MSHVGIVRGREILLVSVVPVRIAHYRAVDDEACVAVDAAQCLIVSTLRGRTSLASRKHTVHDRTATYIEKGGAVGRVGVAVA